MAQSEQAFPQKSSSSWMFEVKAGSKGNKKDWGKEKKCFRACWKNPRVCSFSGLKTEQRKNHAVLIRLDCTRWNKFSCFTPSEDYSPFENLEEKIEFGSSSSANQNPLASSKPDSRGKDKFSGLVQQNIEVNFEWYKITSLGQELIEAKLGSIT